MKTLEYVTNSEEFLPFSKFIMIEIFYQKKEFTFSMTKANKADSEAFASCSTIIKDFDFNKMLNGIVDILFSPEMIEYEIEKVYYENVFNAMKISWMNHDKTESTCLAIKRLFNKQFPSFSNYIHHFAPHLITLKQLDHQKDISLSRVSRLFKAETNKLKICNRNNSNFDGPILLICSIDNPTKDPFLEFYKKETFKSAIKTWNRFGFYSSNNELSRSFIFQQLKVNLKDEAGNKAIIMNYNELSNLRKMIVRPPKGIKSIDQFVNLIIQLVLDNCN